MCDTGSPRCMTVQISNDYRMVSCYLACKDMTNVLAISENPRLKTHGQYTYGTIHHTNQKCLFFITGRANNILPQESHPD